MVDLTIEYTNSFKKNFSKIKDKNFKEQVKKQIIKIIDNPLIGKPMRNIRKGTREVYVKPYRLGYIYENNKLYLLFVELYHKKKQ